MKSRFKTLDEFYEAVDNLIARMRISGFLESASRLNSLMHETVWTTGSELLGELQIALKDMTNKFPEDVDKEIRERQEFAIHHRKILGLSN